MTLNRSIPPDQAERDAAIRERTRNVLIDAGAGTGKTTILVDRLVEMLAPSNGERPIPIPRIAAVTFTRRAAGELRLRIREKVLRALAEPAIDEKRRRLLHEALAGIDTASIGTIHSFADRLLRQRPREARLSPAYELYEDTGTLILETFTLFLHASQTGTLKAELEATEAAARAAEAEQTVRDAISAGVRVDSLELEWGRLGGLDALVEGFVTRRDLPPADPVPEEFDFAEFRGYAAELVALVASMKGASRGAEWLRRTAHLVEALSRSNDPIAIYREVLAGRMKPPDYKKGEHFEGEKDAWAVWKTFTEGKDRGDALWNDLVAPLHRWNDQTAR